MAARGSGRMGVVEHRAMGEGTRPASEEVRCGMGVIALPGASVRQRLKEPQNLGRGAVPCPPRTTSEGWLGN